MTQNISRTNKINGTSLRGYVKASLEELNEVFGNPCIFSPSSYEKVQIEWRLQFSDPSGEETVATIYDWKQYGFIPDAAVVVEWNVGGRSTRALELVQEALNDKRQKTL